MTPQKILFILLVFGPALTSLQGFATWIDTPWFRSFETPSHVYFLYRDEASATIQVYNRLQKQWQEPLLFDETATAFTVTDDAIYIAFGRNISKFDHMGGQEQHLGNTLENVQLMAVADGRLFIGQNHRLQSLDRHSGEVLSDVSFYIPSFYQFLNGDLYFSDGHQGGTLFHYRIDPEGVPNLVNSTQFDYDLPIAGLVYPNPDRNQIISDSSLVVDHATMTYVNGLGGAFGDLSYLDDGVALLRGATLFVYNEQFLEVGRLPLPSRGLKVIAEADQITVFMEQDGGLVASDYAIADLSFEQGTAVDPTNLEYYPQEILVDRDGVLYLMSWLDRTIFRWSTTEQRYLEGIGLAGKPRDIAYCPESHHLYIGFEGGAIHQIDLSKGLEQRPFVNLPASIDGLLVADGHVVVISQMASGDYLWTFTKAGVLSDYTGTVPYPRTMVWNAELRRIYYNHQQGVLYFSMDEQGSIGPQFPSPFSFGEWGPILFTPSHDAVVLENGGFYDPDDFSFVASLSEDLVDGGWFGDRLYTVRGYGETSFLERWDLNREKVSSTTLQGSSYRSLILNQGLVAVTFVNNRPEFYVETWDCSLDSRPVLGSLPSDLVLCPGETINLELEVLKGEWTGLQWRKNGLDLIGETSPELSLSMDDDHVGSYDCVLQHCSGAVVSSRVTVQLGEGLWTSQTPSDWPGVPENPCNDLNGSGSLDLLDMVMLINQREL